ncbi:MAG: helix-turn-helix domain-containing protein [Burkholderiales bacterium]|nr:helix-turn-helix domain-containing protein [Burkholderiales bacterium]MDE2394201.1 helix-turn-helix domain-containing protein [Burkholderiales bacterium]MDE2452854.1 helix-turn-helix domain-containing protein [Burkholderiales bacterium]
MDVTELAARLGMPKSNVHRMLQALVALRYVLRDEAGGSYLAFDQLQKLAREVR